MERKTKIIIISAFVLGMTLLVVTGVFLFRLLKDADTQASETASTNRKSTATRPDPRLPTIDPTTEIGKDSEGISIVRNVLEIIWKEGVTAQQKQATIASVSGTTVRGEIPELGFTEIRVPEESVNTALATLTQQPGVATVTEDYVAEENYEPLDPDYKDAAKNWWLKQVEAEPAWEISQGDPKMLVAIIDGGFLLDHPDLDGVFKDDLGFNYSLQHMSDSAEHGTHVSGIIAMQPNEVGLVGIAPNVKIVPYKIVTFAQMADCIRMATNTTGVKVISMSQGFNWWNTNQQRTTQGLPAITAAAMQTAAQNVDRIMNPAAAYAKQKKVILVHSAGNDHQSAAYNSLNTSDVVTVASTDESDELSSSSNFGTPVTLGAPGKSIWSTVDDYNWKYLSGTSMATPLVAGSIALIRSANPKLSFSNIVSIIQKTGEPSISANLEKRLNTWQALLAATDHYGVTGTVVDKTEHPLINVSVQPKDHPEWAVTSDKLGKFTLAAIPRGGPWEITAKKGEEEGTLILDPLPSNEWVARDVTITLNNLNQPKLDSVTLNFHGEAAGECSYQDAGFKPGDAFSALGCDATGFCSNPTSLNIRFDGPITFKTGETLTGAFTGKLSKYWKENYREGELDSITFKGSVTNLSESGQITLDMHGVQHGYTKDINIHAIVHGTIVKTTNQNDLHYGYTIRVDRYTIDPFKIAVQNPHFQTQQATCAFTYDPATDPLYTNPEDGYFSMMTDYILPTANNVQNDALKGLIKP